MTMSDISGLCERLRKPTVLTSYDGLDPVVLGPTDIRIEAADTLERQAAEIEKLREALDLASRRFYVFRDMTDHTSDRVCLATWADEARAHLTGEN